MDKAILEQEAKKLFGGATIDIKPFQDHVSTAWDITIIPYIDKETRFIRLPTPLGMNGAISYLKKIQQNLLQLNQKGVFGINPIEIPIDEGKVGEEIAKRMSKENMKPIYVCSQCKKIFKYPGPFSMHEKKHKKVQQLVVSAPNDPLIYEVNK